LRVDADYWDEVAPDRWATDFDTRSKMFFCPKGFWHRDGDWCAYHGQGNYDYVKQTNPTFPRPTKTEWTPDKQAVKTLESMGYTYHGGEYWKPPLGKKPDWLEPEWVDGLPPVGSKVRFPTGHGEVVLGPDVNGVLIVERENVSDKGTWVKVAASACKPYQTPEQRMREELLSILEDTGYSTHGQADAILKWMKDNNLTEK
jgi:hypothetical protein